MRGLVVLLALVATSLGAPHQSLAEPPTCPEATPGVALNVTFYPNDDDCTKYWVCDNGNLYNCSCPDYLAWNPYVGYCDWPFTICVVNKKQPVVSCHQPRAEPPVCPEAIPGVALNITFYPNEDDHTKYWVCDNGNLYNCSCPDFMMWNPFFGYCDWPYGAGVNCEVNKKQPVVSHHQPRAEPPVCPEAIPGVALNIIFYPNKDDRNKYWECDNGNLYNRSCPDGMVWNPNMDSCDWPFNYDCPYFKRRGSK